MIETLIALMLALGLTFSKSESGQLSIDSQTMSTLQQNEKFQKDFPADALTDIVVTDDDDPIEDLKE
ncbi:MAG: hypothetical protein IPI10_11640 [Bacteroidetes bacterium]|nr:hypothetical protein [Bacteroidota bacterium]